MLFQKKTSAGRNNLAIRFLLKFIFIIVLLFFLVALVNKINFPYPNKKIEKNISNDTFKVVK